MVDLVDGPEGQMKFETRHSPLTLADNPYSCDVDLLTSRCVHATVKSPAFGEGADDGFVGGASLGIDRRRY